VGILFFPSRDAKREKEKKSKGDETSRGCRGMEREGKKGKGGGSIKLLRPLPSVEAAPRKEREKKEGKKHMEGTSNPFPMALRWRGKEKKRKEKGEGRAIGATITVSFIILSWFRAFREKRGQHLTSDDLGEKKCNLSLGKRRKGSNSPLKRRPVITSLYNNRKRSGSRLRHSFNEGKKGREKEGKEGRYE